MSTKIEWCEETWNPIIGCSHVSPGCDNCYAERLANIRMHNPKTSYYKEVMKARIGQSSVWNGKTHLVETALEKPLHWKKPRTIFVCSMGDLFHESVPFEWIDKVMAIAAVSSRHDYLILTKRPERMKEYFNQGVIWLAEKWENAIYSMGIADALYEDPSVVASYLYNRISGTIQDGNGGWPLSNVWLGVTAENQEQADKRIPILMRIRAAKRFMCIEPMLGPVDITNEGLKNGYSVPTKIYNKIEIEWTDPGDKFIGLHWVIVGGETGPGARPMHPDWVRSLRDQCQSAGVPFFFKQWGEYIHGAGLNDAMRDEVKARKYDSKIIEYQHPGENSFLFYAKMGKKKAGHLLDGKEWRERP